ncbi:MAG: Abi-alpha family protein, partial [Thermocrispum sp.]
IPSIPGLPVRPDSDLAQGLPGLVRVAANSGWRTVSWAVGSTLRTGRDIVQRTLDGEPPAVVLQETTADLRDFAWKALGLDELNQQRQSAAPAEGEQSTRSDGMAGSVTNVATGLLGSLGAFGPSNARGPNSGYRRAQEEATTESLRARGEELLRQSADVDVAEDGHPAYARILSELTPDEARILRFLFREGAQPAIDIRTNRPFGVGSELVAGGLSMIGEHAGLRHLDRIHPYLTNLFRLGLIEFSKETVQNPNRYQVIEAQPRMAEAMAKAGRGPRIVRRSILLNAFGQEFCKVCLFDEAVPAPATDQSKET